MDTLNKIDIIRVNTSSYQGEDFQRNEQRILEDKFPINYQVEKNTSRNHILITNSNTKVEDLIISDKTKLIIHPNSGYDNFSFQFVRDCPCPIIIGNEIRMNAVVNYTISALLNHFNRIPHQKAWDSSRLWNRDLLQEKKILIIGLGHIGSKVKEIVESLGGSPKLYDPFKGHSDLDFKDVEIILLCASLNPVSEKIINEEVLEKVSPNLLIINGARGGLIDQTSLIKFLKLNQNSFAYLDVFEKEPFPEEQFSNLTNICLTSHIAGVHNHLNSNIIQFECKIIESFLNSKSIQEFEEDNRESLLQSKMQEGYLI